MDLHHSNYTKRWMESLFQIDSNRFYNFSPELTPDIVELVSRICSPLGLIPEVEFTCIVNIDRLFQTHLDETVAILKKCETAAKTKELCENTLDTVKSEAILFVVILVVICAKFVDNTVRVYLSDFSDFLKRCHRPSTLNQIKRKEFEIFKMMDYKVQPATAYYSSKYFLELCQGKIRADNARLSSTCDDILRISFLRRQQIYERIDSQVIVDSDRYKADQTLLGVAVVLTAFILSKYSANQVSQILEWISAESEIPSRTILYLSTMIKNEICNVAK